MEGCTDSSAIAAIRGFLFASAGKSVTHQLGLQFWAGAEEIVAAACFLREPIYVLDVVGPAKVYVQMYHLDVVDSISEESRECVRIQVLDSADAYHILGTHLNCRVVPLVLAFHHAQGGGHFTAVRSHDRCYAEWTVLDQNGESMDDRLRWAQSLLGIPVLLPFTEKAARRMTDAEIDDPDYVRSSSDVDTSQESGPLAIEAAPSSYHGPHVSGTADLPGQGSAFHHRCRIL